MARNQTMDPAKPQSAALHQTKVRWQDWSEQAFAQARREGKLVLVDVGAVWCHWCHVMDRNTYDDDEVARIIAERFVAVRVDRDQRPDIDSRLQRAPAIVQSHGNGWPLTAILTPSGHVVFKATYLPPRADAAVGAAMGMAELLERVDGFYRERADEFENAGQDLARRLAAATEQAHTQPGALERARVEQVARGIVSQFDPTFAGFGAGGGAKFPHPSAIDLCLTLARGDTRGGRELRRVALETLDAMAAGGIRDHLGGGFHRYSVDAHWHVPHFEKLANDNAALLSNFARAFAATGEPAYRDAAEGIVCFAREVLTDRQRGGFYGSQDADIGLHDDGDYFTWTRQEILDVLDGPERDAVIAHFGVSEHGDMPHAPGRNVLRVNKSIEQSARLLKVDPDDLRQQLDSAKAKLLTARRQRPTPWIDRTIFTDWNGQFIRAVADYCRWIAPDPDVLAMGERAADRLLDEALRDDGILAHFIPPHDAAGHGSRTCDAFGQLTDHAWLAFGLLGLYAVDGKALYRDAAVGLLDTLVEQLEDRDNGGFFDRRSADGELPLLAQRQKPWEDSPVHSANAVAALALLEAATFADRDDLRQAARRAVESFAGAVTEEIGLFVAGWALAAQRLLDEPAHVLVAGPRDRRLPMLQAAWSAETVFEVLTEPLAADDPRAADRVRRLGGQPGQFDQPVAFVCRAGTCQPPAHSPDELRQRLAR